MLLVVDVGNTNICAGVYDGKKLIVDWRFSTDRTKTSDEFGVILRSFFDYSNVKMSDVHGAIISSVVPPVTIPLVRMFKRYFGIKPLIVGPGLKSGISVKYDNPKEVGADRIVDAAGAIYKYAHLGKPMILLDFGTANTYCALLPNGEYLGGAIAPGINIATEALYTRTAKLPRIELIKPDHVICRNTVNSMQAGCIYGHIGQMECIIRKMKSELGGDAIVIATGGMSGTICSGSDVVDIIDPNLTLDGLMVLYEKNAKSDK